MKRPLIALPPAVVLGGAKKTSRIDFVRFVSPGGAELRAKFPRYKQGGDLCCVSDLRITELADLTEIQGGAVLDELEFSLDFYPKVSGDDRRRKGEKLAEIWAVVVRMICPWAKTTLRPRVALSHGRGHCKTVLDFHETKPVPVDVCTWSGMPLYTNNWADWSARVGADGTVFAPTIYIGDAVEDRSGGRSAWGEAKGHQMRIYIKQMDNGVMLCASEWRVRVEVALGRDQLAQRRLHTVCDITQAQLSALANEYFYFATHKPRALPRPKTRRRAKRRGALHRAVEAQRARAWQQQVDECNRIASTQGYLFCFDYLHVVRWRPNSRVHRVIGPAIHDFGRTGRVGAAKRRPSKSVHTSATMLEKSPFGSGAEQRKSLISIGE